MDAKQAIQRGIEEAIEEALIDAWPHGQTPSYNPSKTAWINTETLLSGMHLVTAYFGHYSLCESLRLLIQITRVRAEQEASK